MNGRWIIYPTTRFVTEDDLRMALSDAVADNEVDASRYPLIDVLEMSLDEVCEILADIGKFTFADPKTNEADLRYASQAEASEAEFDYGIG